MARLYSSRPPAIPPSLTLVIPGVNTTNAWGDLVAGRLSSTCFSNTFCCSTFWTSTAGAGPGHRQGLFNGADAQFGVDGRRERRRNSMPSRLTVVKPGNVKVTV